MRVVHGATACALRWDVARVKEEMKRAESLAKDSSAHHILGLLRNRWAMPKECEMVLLQGYASALQALGFGVVLHMASVRTVRATVWLAAKSQYLQAAKQARKQNKQIVVPPWKPTGATPPLTPPLRLPIPMSPTQAHPHTNRNPHRHALPHTICKPHPFHPLSDLDVLLQAYPDDEDDEENPKYVMGYTLVPPHVMAHFKSLPPWDAFDCAHKRGHAQGIIAARATKNANSRVDIISFSDTIGPESSLTCGAIMGAEQKILAGSKSQIGGSSPCVTAVLELTALLNQTTPSPPHTTTPSPPSLYL